MNGADFNTSLSKLVELILIHQICGGFNSTVSATGYSRNELAGRLNIPTGFCAY